MPMYEYRCQKCEKDFEVLVKFSESEKEQPCPDCKSEETKKKISQTSFSLKGGGWASDGYSS